MSLRYPISRIRHFRCQLRELLAAVAGPSIQIFDAGTGSLLSSWPPASFLRPLDSDISPDRASSADTCAEPPEKRRKLTPPVNESGEAQTEQSAKAKARRSETAEQAWSTIPILVISGTGDHIVAVTGEDKCLRVFEVKQDGKLTQLTERCMPKRPCAISLTPDNNTILCGDKFGDVYSLPLLPRDEVVLPLRKAAESSKPFQPSATKLTVHTQRNLKALEQQLRTPRAAQEKLEPSFQHRLLLGHVSMLTDLILAPVPSDSSTSPRLYIITSDRDEHIRVSRGPSQAHIIHGYCLGHTSFVSKLCIPPWDPRSLISGGGDNCIICWDWLAGRVAQTISLVHDGDVAESTKAQPPQSDAPDIAVSGIYAIPFSGNPGLTEHARGGILVALEGVSRLLAFSFGTNGRLTALAPIELSGNALDVVALDDRGTILVSVDNVHKPGSTKELRDSAIGPKLLQCFSARSDGGLKWEESSTQAATTINSRETVDIIAETESRKQVQKISDSLYGIGNLRKWARGEDG
ncbi:tRNA (guanine-N(7)-)-methyltransferase non-catalytic subunit trm82 [Coccidioides posadasii str. Silveira]|uniref:Uncharacterized protein n=1 Tax=Coccidioides posadasii (strain RMSCC 757 / Silveira) TaxID=443226 RepID=E9DE72_COCPS|nr:conserved hypothetical protein [Coccidioides posadasii str. Silveira]QVM13418.1 tRNA (guanine-N(7)-)-methyltransferase non-catalytic subunit trm82 [Coccidioides posadasii str. Silveira]